MFLCPGLPAEEEGGHRGLQPWDEGYWGERAVAEEPPTPSLHRVPQEGQSGMSTGQRQ